MCVSSDLLRSLGVTVSLTSDLFLLFQELASLEPLELERNAFNDSLVSLGFVDYGEYYE